MNHRLHVPQFKRMPTYTHPIEKANYLPNHKFLGFQPVIFRGVASKIIRSERFQQDGSRPNISIRSKRANGPGRACAVWFGKLRFGHGSLHWMVLGVRSPGEQSLHWKKYDEKFWSQPIFRWPSRDPQTCFCSRVACPIWMVFLLPVLQVDLWISTCSMYCSPRIFSIEGWGGCCLFRGGGLLLFFKGRHCPPIPGIGSGDVRNLCFSLFLSLLLFRQVRSGRMGSDGLPWRPKCVICFSFLRCLGSSYWTGSWRSSWENLPVLSPHWGGHSVSTMKQHKKSARCTLNVWCTDWRVQHWGGAAMHWMKTGWNCVLARRVLHAMHVDDIAWKDCGMR